MQGPLYKILSLYAGERLYDILIPFHCQRCGRCCLELGVKPSSLDRKEIANYLGVDWEEVSSRYISVEAKDAVGRYEWMKRWQPCPFLSQEGECIIYPARPSGCRSYPVYTLLGSEGVDCPGMTLMQKVVSVLGRGTPYEFHFPGGEKGERPGPAKIRRFIDKLQRASIPEEMIQELVLLNAWKLP